MELHPLSTSRDCLLGTNQDLVLRHIFHPEKKIGLEKVKRKTQMVNLSEERDYRNRTQPAKIVKTKKR